MGDIMNNDFLSYLQGDNQNSFNDYGAGNKVYGGGRSNPTSGPVDLTGYKERDAKAKGMRNAMLRRMKAKQSGRLFSSDNLTPAKTFQGGM
jgi:hypothetical protein